MAISAGTESTSAARTREKLCYKWAMRSDFKRITNNSKRNATLSLNSLVGSKQTTDIRVLKMPKCRWFRCVFRKLAKPRENEVDIFWLTNVYCGHVSAAKVHSLADLLTALLSNWQEYEIAKIAMRAAGVESLSCRHLCIVVTQIDHLNVQRATCNVHICRLPHCLLDQSQAAVRLEFMTASCCTAISRKTAKQRNWFFPNCSPAN